MIQVSGLVRAGDVFLGPFTLQSPSVGPKAGSLQKDMYFSALYQGKKSKETHFQNKRIVNKMVLHLSLGACSSVAKGLSSMHRG